MTRVAEWRQHAACRKQIVALRKRLAVTERALLGLRKSLGHFVSEEQRSAEASYCIPGKRFTEAMWHEEDPAGLALVKRARVALNKAASR
jgi:hypothetical protein